VLKFAWIPADSFIEGLTKRFDLPPTHARVRKRKEGVIAVCSSLVPISCDLAMLAGPL